MYHQKTRAGTPGQRRERRTPHGHLVCPRCHATERKKSWNQIYCGSAQMKQGCAYQVALEKWRSYTKNLSPENKLVRKKRGKQWRENHPEYHKNYYYTHSEKFTEYNKKFLMRNPGYHKDYAKKHKRSK